MTEEKKNSPSARTAWSSRRFQRIYTDGRALYMYVIRALIHTGKAPVRL